MRDHLRPTLRRRRCNVDPVVAHVLAVRRARFGVAQQGERRPFPRIDLADVLGELDLADALAKGAQWRPGLNRLQLFGVADQHQLGVVPRRERDQLGELAVAEHPGLVHDEHTPKTGGGPSAVR